MGAQQASELQQLISERGDQQRPLWAGSGTSLWLGVHRSSGGGNRARCRGAEPRCRENTSILQQHELSGQSRLLCYTGIRATLHAPKYRGKQSQESPLRRVFCLWHVMEGGYCCHAFFSKKMDELWRKLWPLQNFVIFLQQNRIAWWQGLKYITMVLSGHYSIYSMGCHLCDNILWAE